MDWKVFNDTLSIMDPEEYSEFTALFIRECEKDLGVILDAGVDIAAISKACHRLIGRDMQLGCTGLVQAAQLLQTAAKEENMNAIGTYQSDLEGTWETTRPLIRRH